MAYVIGNDCIACGTCIDECPVEAISEWGRGYLIVYKNISAIFLKIPSYYRIIAYFILIMGWFYYS